MRLVTAANSEELDSMQVFRGIDAEDQSCQLAGSSPCTWVVYHVTC